MGIASEDPEESSLSPAAEVSAASGSTKLAAATSDAKTDQSPVTKPVGQTGGLLGDVFKGGVLVAVVLAACYGLLLLTALIVRLVDPETQIILSGINGPYNLASESSATLGKEASDLFSDDVNEIIQAGSTYAGNSSASSKSRTAAPFEPVPQVPISRSYGLEIQGISLDELVNLFARTRYSQMIVSGDLLPEKGIAEAPGSGRKQPADRPEGTEKKIEERYLLNLTWQVKGFTYHWSSPKFTLGHDGLSSQMRAAAENFVKETNPEIAGRYYLTNNRYSDAINTFTLWMNRERSRPEPYWYLARTYDLTGDFLRAVSYAQRANDLKSYAPGKVRKRIEIGYYQVKSLQFFVSNGATADEFKSYVDKYLAGDPNARTNLGLRFLQLHRYDDAIRELNLVLAKEDPNDYAAKLHLGESYEGRADLRQSSKDLTHALADYKTAAQTFQQALGLRPDAGSAAEGYVESVYKSGQASQASQFCDAWVYPAPGAVAPIGDSTDGDLYSACAQAEESSTPQNPMALRWFYEQMVLHNGDDASSVGATESQDELQKMVTSVCSGNPAIGSDSDQNQLGQARHILSGRLAALAAQTAEGKPPGKSGKTVIWKELSRACDESAKPISEARTSRIQPPQSIR